MNRVQDKARRGFALLTVLGAIVVLSAVALALSSTVRTEVSASSNRADDLRAYYLAQAGMEEALYLVAHGVTRDTPTLRQLQAPVSGGELDIALAEGLARVRVRLEAGKLDINQADEELLTSLLRQMGVNQAQAGSLAEAIVHWRSPQAEGTLDALDRYYRSQRQPYAARHNRFATVEELLQVRGMTRNLLYGTFELDSEGNVSHRGGFIHYVTVYSRTGLVDANSASYEVLRALGLSDSAAHGIIAARRAGPFSNLEELQAVAGAVPSRLSLMAGDKLEMVATGEPSGTAVRHTIRAIVKLDPQAPRRYRILTWYDQNPLEQQ